MNDGLIIVGALFVIGIFLGLIGVAIKGAIILFKLAAEQGFIGLAAYVACCVFLFPVMLIICIVVGLFKEL